MRLPENMVRLDMPHNEKSQRGSRRYGERASRAACFRPAAPPSGTPPIAPVFLSKELTALGRDGKAESRVTRRANALLLLDDGWSCERVAQALYMDDGTIRYWNELYQEKGLKWLARFGYKGRVCEMTAVQQEALKKWVAETLPRTTTAAGEWIERTCGINSTRSAIIKLRKRLCMEYRKPKALPRKLDPAKQAAFIKEYEDLLNRLADDQTVMFAGAVHPTHEARPAGCWAPKGQKIVIGQTSGSDRLNIHGAVDLETGNTRMIELLTVNALSTIALLMAIEIMYPFKRWIHVFLDNARYHHAGMVKEWLAREGMPDQTAHERSASNALDAWRVAE